MRYPIFRKKEEREKGFGTVICSNPYDQIIICGCESIVLKEKRKCEQFLSYQKNRNVKNQKSREK